MLLIIMPTKVDNFIDDVVCVTSQLLYHLVPIDADGHLKVNEDYSIVTNI